MISIYSDKNFLVPNNFACHMLLPFWEYQKKAGEPDADRFDKYIKDGPTIFRMTSLDDADIVIYPSSPTYDPVSFKKFQEITNPKHMIVFFNDDSDITLSYRNNTTVLRTSFYKSSQRPTEFALPGWSTDYGAFQERIWNTTPTISFCGNGGRPERYNSLAKLKSDSRVKTNFILRDMFWGGFIASGRNPAVGKKVRQEFLQNVNEGDYVFCARGGGNFSYRLYEAMMCGRLPLFVNTDSVIPYDFIINWRDHFPIIEEKEIPFIVDKLLEFHNAMTPEKFIEKQKIIRKMWENWISPVGFFSNLYRHWISPIDIKEDIKKF